MNLIADFNASLSFADGSIEPNGTTHLPIFVDQDSMLITLDFWEAGRTLTSNVSALGRHNYTLSLAQIDTFRNISLRLNGYVSGVLHSTANGRLADGSFHSAGEDYVAELKATPEAGIGDRINLTLSEIGYILETEIVWNESPSQDPVRLNGTCYVAATVKGVVQVRPPFSWTPIAWMGTAALGSASIVFGVLIFFSRREILKLEKTQETGGKAPVENLCPKCGSVNSSNAGFCRKCGAKL